jgi:hypothetical protein
MTIPTLTSAPPAPLRSQAPAAFTLTAENFVDWQSEFPDEMNAVIAEINALGFSVNSWKVPVRVATTANGTLATAFANGQTVDGVTLATDDRILIKNQTAAAENGVYVVAASGAPTRSIAFDTNDEVVGAAIYVVAGTTNGGTLWFNTNTTAPTIGSTSITFAQFSGALSAAADTDIWTGSSTSKAVTAKALFDAAKFQTLTDGATITPDFGAGLNFKVTLGGNRTLANPTNAKDGQSGVIRVIQDGTGGRTLAYGSNWRFPGGTASGGVPSTTAGAIDLIAYVVGEGGLIYAVLTKAYAA